MLNTLKWLIFCGNCDTIQKLNMFKINMFILQRYTKLVKGDSKFFYNCYKIFIFQINSNYQKNPGKMHHSLHKNIKQHNFSIIIIDNNIVFY